MSTQVVKTAESRELDLDLRLAPDRTTRHQFREQIARLELRLTEALTKLDANHRPSPRQKSADPAPRMLTGEELEATRDALVARLSEVQDVIARQTADYTGARALLKRMSDAPAEYRWTKVTTKDMGVEGCRSWQSVPVMGPVGMLGNWWRIRVSSGCP